MRNLNMKPRTKLHSVLHSVSRSVCVSTTEMGCICRDRHVRMNDSALLERTGLDMTVDTERTRTKTGGGSPPGRTGVRLKWHHIYYLLAVFDLATVSLSLLLTHQILDIYRASVE